MVLKKVAEWSEDKRGLYFILFISATLKLLIFGALSDTPINPDGVLYISAAQQFAEGNFKEGLALHPMPLYPALIAIVHLIIPHWVMAARLISYTSLVLLVIPLYYLITHLFGRSAAFWGSFAFALAPMPNGWVVDVIRGPSFVFVLAWAVYFSLLAVCSEGIKYFLIAAFFGWLAVCLRIEGIIFIPFFWGFRHSLQRSQVLVLTLVILYLLMVYYHTLRVDFIRARFLFAPAFFIYPWIGEGLKRMFSCLKHVSKPKFLTVIFVSIFILSPIGKSIHSFGKHDSVIIRTGEWLAAQPELAEAKIATNDARFLLYAGRKSYAGNKNEFRPYEKLRYDYSAIEHLAIKHRKDILIIRTSDNKMDMLSGIKHFKKIKEFIGRKNIAVIYCSPEFLKTRR